MRWRPQVKPQVRPQTAPPEVASRPSPAQVRRCGARREWRVPRGEPRPRSGEVYRSVSVCIGPHLPVPARSCRCIPGPRRHRDEDTRLLRQPPPQFSSNHRARYFENCGRCPITDELSAPPAGLRSLGARTLRRLRLLFAPPRAAHTGRAGGMGPTRAKRVRFSPGEGAGPRLSLLFWVGECPGAPGGARGTASSRPNRVAERGCFRPAPQSPAPTGWARPRLRPAANPRPHFGAGL